MDVCAGRKQEERVLTGMIIGKMRKRTKVATKNDTNLRLNMGTLLQRGAQH